jgi:hypothetical protein
MVAEAAPTAGLKSLCENWQNRTSGNQKSTTYIVEKGEKSSFHTDSKAPPFRFHDPKRQSVARNPGHTLPAEQLA